MMTTRRWLLYSVNDIKFAYSDSTQVMIFSSLSYLRESTKDQSVWVVPDRRRQTPSLSDVGGGTIVFPVVRGGADFRHRVGIGLA